MTPFEYLQGIQDKVQSDGNISKPIIPQRIERTVHGKKWSDLTPVERFNNRKGRVDGKPQEQGLILDHTDFDILTLAPQLIKSIIKSGIKTTSKAYSLVDDASKLSEKELLEKYPSIPNKGWFDIMKIKKKDYLEQLLNKNTNELNDITFDDLTTGVKNQLKSFYNKDIYKNRARNVLGDDTENFINTLNQNIDNVKVYKTKKLGTVNEFSDVQGVTETLGNNGNILKQRIRITDNLKDNAEDILYHEMAHGSSGIGSNLPKKVINYNESIKPKLNFDRSWNPQYYDYLNTPDEIRARAINTAKYLEKNNIQFDNLNINASNYKSFPTDVFEYVTKYDKNSAKKYLESFLTIAPVISGIDKTINNNTASYKNGGIHIKKANRGKFTASAKRAGQSVQQHAHSVLRNPKATKLQKKRAQFAVNMKAIANKRKRK